VTADLADLLQWLLEKNPANRGNWYASFSVVVLLFFQITLNAL